MPMTLEDIQKTDFIKSCHQILKDHAPGAAFDGEPFLVPQRGEVKPGTEYFAANCFYHTVLVLADRVAVFSRDEGGMVPWIGNETLYCPDPDYLVAVVPSDLDFFARAQSDFVGYASNDTQPNCPCAIKPKKQSLTM